MPYSDFTLPKIQQEFSLKTIGVCPGKMDLFIWQIQKLEMVIES